jgi:hypothetical protein
MKLPSKWGGVKGERGGERGVTFCARAGSPQEIIKILNRILYAPPSRTDPKHNTGAIAPHAALRPRRPAEMEISVHTHLPLGIDDRRGSCRSSWAIQEEDPGGPFPPIDAVNGTEGAQEQGQHSQPHRVLENDVFGCRQADVVEEAVARQRGIDHRLLLEILRGRHLEQ